MHEQSSNGKVPVSVFLQKERYIGRRKFYDLLKNGTVPHYRLGRKILVDREEVMAAMKRGGNSQQAAQK